MPGIAPDGQTSRTINWHNLSSLVIKSKVTSTLPFFTIIVVNNHHADYTSMFEIMAFEEDFQDRGERSPLYDSLLKSIAQSTTDKLSLQERVAL